MDSDVQLTGVLLCPFHFQRIKTAVILVDIIDGKKLRHGYCMVADWCRYSDSRHAVREKFVSNAHINPVTAIVMPFVPCVAKSVFAKPAEKRCIDIRRDLRSKI